MKRTSLPRATDEAGWAALVATGELGACEPGAIVGAIRALHLNGDQRLVQALTLHVSDRITKRLRRLIGRGHPNQGEDIIEHTHGVLIAAIFDRKAADGADLVDAFWPRVRFRGIDAARLESKFPRRILTVAISDDGEPMIPAKARLDGGAGSVDVSHVLSRIRDPRKRLAFRLFMDGMRVRQGDPCIATVCGCDPKTAAKWIAEARAILAAEIGA